VNKSIRVRKAGDVACMVKMKGPLRRPKCIWEDYIKIDIEEGDVRIWAVYFSSG
jgi:hypothetical protein